MWQITKSGLSTSTPVGQIISPAVTVVSPTALILKVYDSSSSIARIKFLMFKIIAVTSSTIPGIAVN